MTELLKVILHDFWSFAGTVILLTLTGAFACAITENLADMTRRKR